MSVVAATPQAYLLYVEQAPFVTHPAPLVVQLGKIKLQALSDVNETGSKSQFNFIHYYVTASHPHYIVSEPINGVLLHSNAVTYNPQKEGLVLH